MKEERILIDKVGRENCFSVPDGYFSHFAEQVVARLPEQEDATKVIRMQPSFWKRLPLRKIAAVVGVVITLGCGIVALEHRHGVKVSATLAATEHRHVEYGGASLSVSDNASFDQMADYAMIDNQDIYATLMAE